MDIMNNIGQENIQVTAGAVALSSMNVKERDVVLDAENSIWNNFDSAWCTHSIIKAYLNTTKRTLPYNRNFGLPFDIVDKPQGVAYAMLATDIFSNLNRYVSGVEVARIDVQAEDNGILRPSLIFKGI